MSFKELNIFIKMNQYHQMKSINQFLKKALNM